MARIAYGRIDAWNWTTEDIEAVLFCCRIMHRMWGIDGGEHSRRLALAHRRHKQNLKHALALHGTLVGNRCRGFP